MHTITLYLLGYCVERKNEMFFSDIIEFVNKKYFILHSFLFFGRECFTFVRKIEIYEAK